MMTCDILPYRRGLIASALAASAAAGSGLGLTSPAGAATPQAERGTGSGAAGPMRTVTLEEHFSVPALAARLPPSRVRARGFPSPDGNPPGNAGMASALADLGAARIADMDAAGITQQVVSWAGPGADLLKGYEGVSWCRNVNAALAAAIAAHPGRYAGFAHLPVTAPEAAADELARCVGELGFVGAMVNGTTDGRFLDHPSFVPLLARAEQLDVPVYLHPSVPPPAVVEAYYGGLPEELGYRLSTSAYDWHAEVGVHVLRLIFSGTLDRHPSLKLIIGHAGEYLPMAIERTTINVRTELLKQSSRTVSEQLRAQVWVTTSGQFSLSTFKVALDTFGVDRVLFSVDYPFSKNAEGRAFLDALDLTSVDHAKISHVNADALLKLTTS